MTRICWWIVDILCRILEPGEREAVLGDIAEAGESCGHALRDVLGLVVRRQAAQWQDWRPWLALIGLVGPAGLLLSSTSISVGRLYDLNFWILRNCRVIDTAILEQTGLTLRHGIALLIGGSFVLVCWSWTSGFVIGSLSRRTITTNGALFCLMLLLAGAPRFSNGATLYSVMFPLIAQIGLVLGPSLWGMHVGGRLPTRPRVQMALWTGAIVTALAAPRWIWWPFEASFPTQLLHCVVFWPIGYLVASAARRRWLGIPGAA